MLSEDKNDKKVRDDEEIGANDGAVIEMKDHRRSVKLKYVILLIIAIALIWFFSRYLRWNGFSPIQLEQAESLILSNVRVPLKKFNITVTNSYNETCNIWTVSTNTEKSGEIPIVMIHGFAAGVAFWVLNIDEIAADRPLYAFDLPGFARSCRPKFSEDAEEIELQFVQYIEQWREQMGLEKMILLGHSFGGFLSTSYAIQHPDRVEHLILADPWGFTTKPDLSNIGFVRKSMLKLFQNMKPLALIRAAGPYGEWLVKTARKDILAKYQHIMEDQSAIAQYIHQSNIRHPASGEIAFKDLLEGGPWAKFPMGDRMKEQLDPEIPVTFLYGATSWMNNTYGEIIKESRKPPCYTVIEDVKFAGHHVYSDNAVDFNQFVNKACEVVKSRRR